MAVPGCFAHRTAVRMLGNGAEGHAPASSGGAQRHLLNWPGFSAARKEPSSPDLQFLELAASHDAGAPGDLTGESGRLSGCVEIRPFPQALHRGVGGAATNGTGVRVADDLL